MKRNSCVMIIFLYFMDDVLMNFMVRGYFRYRFGWFVIEVVVLLFFGFFFIIFYLESI